MKSQRSVLFVSQGETNSSTRYRATAFFSFLQDAGWDATHVAAQSNVAARKQILELAKQADVVVVLRKTFTWPFRRLLRRAARQLVFDFDDAVYVRDTGEGSWSRRMRFRDMVKCCDEVWAGNAHLASQAQRYKQRVAVLPTVMNLAHYDEQVRDHVVDEVADSPLDLVWIGTRSNQHYLESIMPALDAAHRVNKQLRLKIVADFTLASESIPVVAVPWSHAGEVKQLRQSHIGLAPFIDNAWTLGKCGCKVLQYMAAGLPVIASDVGVHGELVVQGETGLLVPDCGGAKSDFELKSQNDLQCQAESAWCDAIVKLAADAKLRAAMGLVGRRRVEEKYCVQTCAAKMIERLNMLVKTD